MGTSLFLRFLGTFVFCLLSLFEYAQPAPNVLVLTNANVVDTRTGSVAPHLTVVIKDGKIRALAKVGFIDGSRSTRVVNAGGKYLIPGLWDMHVRSAGAPDAMWDENIIYPLYIANGVTGVRDMQGEPNLLEQRRERIRKGELLGPHIVFAGATLDAGHSSPQTLAVNTPVEGRQAVRSLKERGVDFIKLLPHVPRDTYLAIADEATRLKMRFVGQVPESVSVAEASASGQRSIEHLSGVILGCSSREKELREKWLLALTGGSADDDAALAQEALNTYDPQKAWKLFVEFTNNNTYQVPALVWWRAGATLDTPGLAMDPRLKYVPAGVRAEWQSETRHQQATEEKLAALKQLSTRYLELVHAMHRAGVPFMTGTDGPQAYVIPGFSLHDEMELLGKSGFTNADALAAATFYPALFMVKLDQYGVIEPGRVADLVLLDANPLEDIRNTRRISAVILGGRYYSRSELDRTLGQVAQAASKQDVMAATR